jgi:hypothetical protein
MLRVGRWPSRAKVCCRARRAPIATRLMPRTRGPSSGRRVQGSSRVQWQRRSGARCAVGRCRVWPTLIPCGGEPFASVSALSQRVAGRRVYREARLEHRAFGDVVLGRSAT